MEPDSTVLEDYSQAYYYFDVDVVPWGGDYAIIADDLAQHLAYYVPEPIVRLDNLHYELYSEHGVPSATVAVPRRDNVNAEAVPLVPKTNTIRELLFYGDIRKRPLDE